MKFDIEKIKRLMISKGLCIFTLARMSDVSHGTVRRLITGQPVRLSSAYQIAKALEVEVFDILDGESFQDVI